jgi:hypothetical protein
VTVAVCSGYGGGLAVEDQHQLSSRRAAEFIGRELASGDLNFAFRIMVSALADFRATSPENREDFLVPPASIGSVRWDTLLQGLLAVNATGSVSGAQRGRDWNLCRRNGWSRPCRHRLRGGWPESGLALRMNLPIWVSGYTHATWKPCSRIPSP